MLNTKRVQNVFISTTFLIENRTIIDIIIFMSIIVAKCTISFHKNCFLVSCGYIDNNLQYKSIRVEERTYNFLLLISSLTYLFSGFFLDNAIISLSDCFFSACA